MRHLTTAAVLVAALLSPTAASAQSTAPASGQSAQGAAATQQADRAFAARPKKGRKGRKTKVRMSFDGAAVPVGTPVTIAGKVKDRGKKKRVVFVQQRHADGWKKVARTKSNRKGRFSVSVPTDWFHSMKTRVVVKPNKGNGAGKSKAKTVSVGPAYVPAGNPATWAYVNPKYRVRYNPCKTIRYRINVAQAPADAEAAVHEAMATLGQASGLRFKFLGHSTGIFHGLPGQGVWEPDADILVSWAQPAQTDLDFVTGRAWGGGVEGYNARDAFGSMVQITRGGATFDATRPWPYALMIDTVLHEVGHVIGLGHVNDPTQIMATGVDGPYILGAGDLAGLNTVGRQSGCVKRARNGRAAADEVSVPMTVLP